MVLRGGAGLTLALSLFVVLLFPIPSVQAQAACHDFSDPANDLNRQPQGMPPAPADDVSGVDRAEITGGCLSETITAIEIQINTDRAPGAPGAQQSYSYTLTFKNATSTITYTFANNVATPAGTSAVSGTGLKFTISKQAVSARPGSFLGDFVVTSSASFVTATTVFTGTDRAPNSGTVFPLDSAPYIVGTRAPDTLDSDGDGAPDKAELTNGTDPSSPDTDHDGLLDGASRSEPVGSDNATNLTALGIYQVSNDGTTITFGGEADYGTNATRPDTDGDGLLDGANVLVPAGSPAAAYFANFSLTPIGSGPDGDLYLGELQYGSDPLLPDTDADGLLDRQEITGSENAIYTDSSFFSEYPGSTNPNEADSDGDRLTDAEELSGRATSPDGVEATFSPLNPNEEDTDLDGLSDYDEVFGRTVIDGQEIRFTPTDPTKNDSDGDGHSDYDEVRGATDPQDPGDVPGEDEAPGGAETSYLVLSTIAMLVVILLCVIGILVRWG